MPQLNTAVGKKKIKTFNIQEQIQEYILPTILRLHVKILSLLTAINN